MTENKVMTLDELVAALNKPEFNGMECSRKTGIHHNTIKMIKIGQNQNPTWRVMVVLSKYLRG